MGSDQSTLNVRVVNALSTTTGFTATEIRDLYRHFRALCIHHQKDDDLHMKDELINKLYDNAFKGRNTIDFARHLFRTMDIEKTSHLDFKAFILGMDIHLKGKLDDKIAWAFRLFDMNDDGSITPESALDVIESYYELEANFLPMEDAITPLMYRDLLFRASGCQNIGMVDKDAFTNVCNENKSVQLLVETLSKAAAEPYYAHKRKTGSFGRRRAATVSYREPTLSDNPKGGAVGPSEKRRTVSTAF